MRKSGIMLFFLLIFAILIVPGFADAPPSVPEVHLKAGTVTPSVSLGTSSVSFSGRRPYIIHLGGPIEDSWKGELQALGVSLSRYLPDYAYLAVLDSSQLDSVRGLFFVEGISSYAASYKIDPSLNDVASSNEDVFLEVRIFPETDVSEALLEADKAGTSFPSFSDGVASLHTSSDNIEKIASLSFVEWVALRPTYSVLNDQGGLIIGANYTSFNYGLNGSGQTIAIADSGLDTGDIATILRDFWNRTTIANIDCTAYSESCTSPDDDLGHGTHVAGSAVGDGNLSFGQFRGTAFGANLFFQAIGDDAGTPTLYPPSDLHNLFAPAYGNGSRIHSNSWGGTCFGGSYNPDSVEVDDYAFNNTDFLILFAGGNEGGTSNTVVCPATAKNILSIAATEDNHPDQGAASDNINQVASFSSRGLTDDGRVKPDLAAPGTNVISTQSTIGGIDPCKTDFASNANYSYCDGTSMATPLAAGAAALVRQYYVENKSITPTSSLIKASLINGAQDVGYGIPSNQTGWGRINISNSVFPVSPRTILYQDNVSFSSTGNSTIFNYTVVNKTVELKATLVWTDYPSTASASVNLVNNLDLRVTSPNGTVFYGNDFTSPHNSTLDTLNNVEQVILPTPDNGTYLVNVTGQNIPNGPQTFSLVVSGGIDNAPQLSNILPLNDTFFTTPSASINYTIVDTTDATVTCSLTLDSGLNQTHASVPSGTIDSFNLTVSAEQHSFAVSCNDTSTTTTSETRIFTVDITDPLVSLATPLDNTFSNTTVQFNFTATDTNLANCTLYSNFPGTFMGNETVNTSSGVLTSFSNISLPDADYTWNVQCLDKAGRTAFNESNYTVKVDSNPPSLFISHPQNITYTDVSNLSFNFSAIDPHLSVRWFGVDAGTNITLSGNTTFASSGEGPHTIFLYANDTILQQNRTSVSFSLDSIVPIVYLESPVNGTNSTSTSVGFSYNVTDTFLANCSLYFDGSLDQTDHSISVNTSQSFSKTFTSSNNGDHLWAVRCIDNAGNSNTTSNYSISLSISSSSGGGSSGGSGGGGGGGSSSGTTSTSSDTSSSDSFSSPSSSGPTIDSVLRSRVLNSVDTSELSTTDFSEGNIEVVSVGEDNKVTKSSSSLVSEVLSSTDSSSAKDILERILKSSALKGELITTSSSLRSFSITAKDTGKSVDRTEVTIDVSTIENVSDVFVVEIIPKDVASNVSELSFTDLKPVIIEEDPIFSWNLTSLSPSEGASFRYFIKKKVDTLSWTSVAGGNSYREEGSSSGFPVALYFLIAAGILFIILIIYHFWHRHNS